MIVTCPSCSARFRLADDALGETGRRLRCGRCKHAWHQAPLEEPPAPQSEDSPAPSHQEQGQEGQPRAAAGARPSLQGDRRGSPAAQSSDLLSARLGDTEAARRARLRDEQVEERQRTAARQSGHQRLDLDPVKSSSKAPLVVGWSLVLILLAAVLAGGWYFRDQVVAAIPEAARLYAALGIEAEAGRDDGLEVQNVAFREEEISGDPTLVVTGTIFNSSTSTRPVPTVIAVASNASGQPLAEWRFRAAVLSLPPGGSQPFEARHPYPNHKGPITVTVSLQEQRR